MHSHLHTWENLREAHVTLCHGHQFMGSRLCDQSRGWKTSIARFSDGKIGESKMSKWTVIELEQQEVKTYQTYQKHNLFSKWLLPPVSILLNSLSKWSYEDRKYYLLHCLYNFNIYKCILCILISTWNVLHNKDSINIYLIEALFNDYYRGIQHLNICMWIILMLEALNYSGKKTHSALMQLNN